MVFNAEVMRRQAGQLDEELALARFSGQSRDGEVTAVVSGHGRILDLSISQSVMRGAHPQVVGSDVEEAVVAARRKAAAVAGPKMRAVLDKDLVWQPAQEPSATGVSGSPSLVPADLEPTSGRPSAVARPKRAAIEDENFEELDFLEDDGGPDEDRGRW
ncbi:YbaB/EbfC family nucleoid-associated protein [Amycolatopsis kentuckyensis]|uniref:YbaB/EbfC family nucleoid-associated protein n=1 Tax=Amycolatopsis kentuckyensis TaxID=218823 RepID=UPI001FC95FC8|nr:YbaB/EbfC family nucleoid-associated protein [Amycolatopsis kentuckyensis]